MKRLNLKDKIVVVFSSHLGDEKNNKFIKHIDDTIGVNHEVVCYTNYNQFSLTELYNKAIKEHNSPDAIFVFCHPDITIKTRTWGRLLLSKFNNSDFSIIGVAGSIYMPASGMWWEDRSKMVGVVEHTDGIQTWVSEYAVPIKGYTKPVAIIDGVFMAVDCNNIEHQFDEEFKGFHFYEISMVFPNYLDGCEIGVTTDIRILHQSVGMTNQQWEDNRAQFAVKYKDDLPIYYSKGDNDDDILVNVLTRTHNRPENFKICRESIIRQTYKNINHIVGTDTECSYYDAIKVSPQVVQQPQLMPEYRTYPAPWNLYLNELGKLVKDGWIIHLDDDDMFSNQNAIKIIVNNVDNNDQILLWRVNINLNNNSWIVPSNEAFGRRIEAGNFSGIGMMFHSKHLPVDWGSWSYGDFRVASQLLAKKLKPKWIDLILTQTQGTPNNGRSPNV
jgi:hypothetical protein